MGLIERRKLEIKQRVKRQKKRLKLLKKGLKPDDFYSGKFYVGHLKGDEK